MSQTETNLSKKLAENDGHHHFSHFAMATTFELFIFYQDQQYASQAALAAFTEVDRLEQALSRFIENSDISRINHLGANQKLKLGLDAFECLQLCAKISVETNGAFDVTIGSLLKCWYNQDKTPRTPSDKELKRALEHTGMQQVILNENDYTVQITNPPINIDLGGFGKGYAVDRVSKLLRDWDLDIALIHGGFSSVLALEAAPGQKGWPVTLSNPVNPDQVLARVNLKNRALSSSGRRKGQHIINPVTGHPVSDKGAAWAFAPDAALSDALSTAFMVLSPTAIDHYCTRHPEVQAFIITRESGKIIPGDRILRCGFLEE